MEVLAIVIEPISRVTTRNHELGPHLNSSGASLLDKHTLLEGQAKHPTPRPNPVTGYTGQEALELTHNTTVKQQLVHTLTVSMRANPPSPLDLYPVLFWDCTGNYRNQPETTGINRNQLDTG